MRRPMIQLAWELYRVARARLGEQADYLEAIKLIEREAGVEIRHDTGSKTGQGEDPSPS
ncbi:MAG: hypothetical protein ACREMO_11470 [Gemmatimonadales bacterium]